MLTSKLQSFVEHYTGDCEGNGAKAAEAVGCSKKSAKVMAARWLKRADVKAAIVNLREQIDNQRKQAAEEKAAEEKKAEDAKIADLSERRSILSSIARLAKDKDRVRALDVLNKMDGLYITKIGDPKGQPLIPPGSSFAFVVTQIPGAENRT